MMNLLAIGLVLTSLITGTVWSPSPPPAAAGDHDGREVIVKEGHRVVVVEYEKEGDDGNTKVLISPHDPSGVDFKDASDDTKGVFSGPRELVCDAYGKCKHKIASAVEKTKEKVSETVHGVSDKAQDVEEHGKEAVTEAFGKGKQAAGEMYEKVSEKVKGREEKAKGHTIGEAISKAKESVAGGVGKAKEVAGDFVGTAKDAAAKTKNFDVVDSPKRIGEDIQRNVTGKVEEGAEQAKENVQKLGEKSVKEVKGLAYNVVRKVFSPSKVEAVVGLIHMLGFSTAYGMCVWVTFVSSYILGRYLPREQFGMVQSKIYPVYFRAMAYCVGVAFLAHLMGQKKMVLSNTMEMFQGLNLLSALLMTLANMIYLEPRATKLMFERMKIQKEEGRGVAGAVRGGIPDCGGETVDGPPADVVAERQDVLRLNDKLKKLNSYSSALNVSTLVALTWHMAYMGQRLKATR